MLNTRIGGLCTVSVLPFPLFSLPRRRRPRIPPPPLSRLPTPARAGLHAGPGFAGTCTLPVCATGAAADQGGIVVTGSRIRRPNLELPRFRSPRSAASSSSSRATQCRRRRCQRPARSFASTFVQQNPGLGLGIAGLNLLDLRGLGTQRTLVLVNGRRHVAARHPEQRASRPDVNTIPTDLIERVDIVDRRQFGDLRFGRASPAS